MMPQGWKSGHIAPILLPLDLQDVQDVQDHIQDPQDHLGTPPKYRDSSKNQPPSRQDYLQVDMVISK